MMNKSLYFLVVAFITTNLFGNQSKYSSSHDTTRIKNILVTASDQFNRNAYDSAIINTDKALDLSNHANYKKGIIDAINLKGLIRFYQSDYDDAFSLTDKGIKLSEELNYRKGKADGMFGMSYVLSVRGDYKKSIDCMMNALKIYKEIHDKSRIGECYEGLGYLYDKTNENTKSLDAYTKALEIYKSLNDSVNIALGLNSLGHWFYTNGDYKRAMENYFEALAIWSTKNDSLHIGIAYGNLANIFKTQKEYEEAQTYYLKQIEILKGKNDYLMAIAYQNIGVNYNNLNDPESAKLNFYEAEKLFSKLDFKPGLVHTYNNLAHAFLKKNRTDSAMMFAHKAMKLSVQLNDQKNIGFSNLLLGRIYLKKGAKNTAGQYLKEAINISKKYGNPETEKQATRLLGDIYAAQGNYRKALELIERHYQLADSLQNQENVKKLTQLELSYEFDKEKQLINLENAREKAMLNAEIRNQRLVRNFLFISSILLLGIIIAVLYAFIQNRKTNKVLRRQKQEIELTNNRLTEAITEKEALIKEIHHRVKNNLQIVSSLLNIQTEYLKDQHIIEAVHESQSRVKAMALIHQLLYQEENFTTIDFKNYLQQLTKTIDGIYKKSDVKIKTEIIADKIALDIDTSIPLGLIVTELVSNAYKYAFEDSKQGHIKIALHNKKDSGYELSISDDGIGLPENFDFENANTMGLKLVKLLAGQIDGELTINQNKGTTFKLIFNPNE